MKKITLFVISILLFSSCGTTQEVDQNPSNPAISADSILDNQIMADAATAKNVSDCNSILDETKKTECITAVESLILLDKAVASTDKSLCKKIKLERYKENCDKQIEERLEYANADKKRKESEAEAIAKSDAGICDDIEDENKRGTCQFNVLSNKAIEENNPKICEGIDSMDIRQQCLNAF